MPSPLTHLFAGAFIAGLPGLPRSFGRLMAVCLFYSIAPDFDALAGIAANRMAEFHNNATHSVLFGLALCGITLPLSRRVLPEWTRRRVFLLTSGCYLLHVALDWMSFGRGVKLLWPISDERFRAPFELFHGLRWSEGILSRSHLDTLINEVAVIAVFLAVFFAVRAFRRRGRT